MQRVGLAAIHTLWLSFYVGGGREMTAIFLRAQVVSDTRKPCTHHANERERERRHLMSIYPYNLPLSFLGCSGVVHGDGGRVARGGDSTTLIPIRSFFVAVTCLQ